MSNSSGKTGNSGNDVFKKASQSAITTPSTAKFTAMRASTSREYPDLLKKILKSKPPNASPSPPQPQDENQNVPQPNIVWKYNEALDDTVPSLHYIETQNAPELFDSKPVEVGDKTQRSRSKSPQKKRKQQLPQKSSLKECHEPKLEPIIEQNSKTPSIQNLPSNNSENSEAKTSHATSQTTMESEPEPIKLSSRTASSSRLPSRASSRTVLSNNPVVLLKLQKIEDGEWLLQKTIGQGLITESEDEVDSIYNHEVKVESVNLSRLPSDMAIRKAPQRNYDEERLVRIRKYITRVNRKMEELSSRRSQEKNSNPEKASPLMQPARNMTTAAPPPTVQKIKEPPPQPQQSKPSTSSSCSNNNKKKTPAPSSSRPPARISYDEMSYSDKFFRLLNALASDGNHEHHSDTNESSDSAADSTNDNNGNATAISDWLYSLLGVLASKLFSVDIEEIRNRNTSNGENPPPQPKTKSLAEQEAEFEESLFNNQSIALLEEVQVHKEALMSQYYTLLAQVKNTTFLMDKVSTSLLASNKSSAANVHKSDQDIDEDDTEEHTYFLNKTDNLEFTRSPPELNTDIEEIEDYSRFS